MHCASCLRRPNYISMDPVWARGRLTTPLQGFRTYPSFLHFLASVTLLATYVAVVCIRGLVFAFSRPLDIVR